MRRERLTTLMLYAPFLVVSAMAAGSQVASAQSPAALVAVERAPVPFDFGGKRVPKWSHGGLVAVENNPSALPVIYAFGRDGALLSRVPLAVPDAGTVLARAFARGPDGTLAVVGSAYTQDSRGALYLAAISGDGRRMQVTRLSPFYPFEVAVAADGSYWVAGEAGEKEQAANPGWRVIRRYGPSGNELGSFVPQSTLTLHGNDYAAEGSFLSSSRDRMAWYSNAGPGVHRAFPRRTASPPDPRTRARAAG